ncbi:protein GrpE, partial [Striga asiatica]
VQFPSDFWKTFPLGPGLHQLHSVIYCSNAILVAIFFSYNIFSSNISFCKLNVISNIFIVLIVMDGASSKNARQIRMAKMKDKRGSSAGDENISDVYSPSSHARKIRKSYIDGKRQLCSGDETQVHRTQTPLSDITNNGKRQLCSRDETQVQRTQTPLSDITNNLEGQNRTVTNITDGKRLTHDKKLLASVARTLYVGDKDDAGSSTVPALGNFFKC